MSRSGAGPAAPTTGWDVGKDVGQGTRQRSTAGALLVTAYTVLAVAAGARAGVQLATKPDHALLAYALSAVAAAVYLVAAVALRRPGRTARSTAQWCLSVELVGVMVVGTLSVARRDWFPDETVWSGYGIGYGLVPLVLPALGLAWLRRQTG